MASSCLARAARVGVALQRSHDRPVGKEPRAVMTRRRDTILRLAKGFRGRAKNCFKIAINRVQRGLQHAYVGRKLKKRVARREWIGQVNAGCQEHGISYSRLIHGMNLSSIGINRKILSQLAQQEPYSFRAIVEEAKESLRALVLRGEKSAGVAAASREPELLLQQPSIIADGDAPSNVDRGIIPPYEGPPLPPYPRRIKQFS